MLRFEDALAIVGKTLTASKPQPPMEQVGLEEAPGRILAKDVASDRDYPPFDRAIRDGFAVRAADVARVPVTLEVIGEVPAGSHFAGVVEAGQCVRIMTGAPLPQGADAVLMVEHSREEGKGVEVRRRVSAFENVVQRGSEAPQGTRLLAQGRRLGAAELALLASVGQSPVKVFRKPSVAILATGDEIVPVESRPEWFQIRNSNSAMLAACVARAGGVPNTLGAVRDEPAALRERISEGLTGDLLLLSGGVSMGRYDLVKSVLAELGAEFYFHGVAIRPGKPLLFGRARETFFFGLPGNPVSSFATFALFARPALSVLAGAEFEHPIFLRACLARPARSKLGLTSFLPARVGWEGNCAMVNPLAWQGSGDLAALAKANCFVVLADEQAELAAGDWVNILMRWE